jgi:hypothetical protein
MQRVITYNDDVPAPWAVRLQNILAGPLFSMDREQGPRFSSSLTVRTRRDIRHSVHVIETREDWFKIEDSFLADIREVPLLSVDVESRLTTRPKTARSNYISLADSSVLLLLASFRPTVLILDFRFLDAREGRTPASLRASIPTALRDLLISTRVLKIGSGITDDILNDFDPL